MIFFLPFFEFNFWASQMFAPQIHKINTISTQRSASSRQPISGRNAVRLTISDIAPVQIPTGEHEQ
jgi:hypothetical protein